MKKKFLHVFLVMVVIIQCFGLTNMNNNAYAAGGLTVEMYEKDLNVLNSIKPNFRIKNTGTTSISLTSVTLRYYYTIDGEYPQSFTCDYSQIGSANVTGKFVKMSTPIKGADYYLEVGFKAGSISAGSYIDVSARINKTNWTNYIKTDDYSRNPLISQTFQGSWDKVTAYNSNALVWGIEPSAGRKFLIIVSKPLYDYGFGEMAAHIKGYQEDLKQEGWNPRIITVDNVNTHNPEFTCPTSDSLKEEIKKFKNQGYEGFVFIGSHPHIQTAFWTFDDGSKNLPTDLFYADMESWGDKNDEGSYIPFTKDTPIEELKAFAPDMIYGRISPGCIPGTDTEQAVKVLSYLKKIHNYRTQGSNLTNEERNRSLLFVDDDNFKWWKDVDSMLKQATSHVDVLYDDSLTTPDRLQDELKDGNGYLFYYQRIHSYPDSHEMRTWPNNELKLVYDYTYDRIINNSIYPRTHYMNLSSCSSCKFNEINNNIVTDCNNIGAAYLFNSGSVLNVTGLTGAWASTLDQDYYKQLVGGTPIGQAYKTYIENLFLNSVEGSRGDGSPKGTLIGDPTIRYKVIPPNNITPIITTNVAGETKRPRLKVVGGNAFEIRATDPDLTSSGRNDSISIELTGNDAASVQMISDSKITYGNSGSDRVLTWIPNEKNIGNTYDLSVKAYNRDANGNIIDNGYTENFTVKIASLKEAVRGDVNGDGIVSSSDTLSLLQYSQNTATPIVFDNADVNNDGVLDVKDRDELSLIIQSSKDLKGDVNGDGCKNSLDLLLIKKYIANSSVLILRNNADMNGDGIVNLSDQLLLENSL